MLRGRLTGEQFEAAADLAESYGSGRPARNRFAKSVVHRRPE